MLQTSCRSVRGGEEIKTALVTGSSGFIGSHLVRALRSCGCKVIEFDCDLGCDVRYPVHRDYECDVIYHLAVCPLAQARDDPLYSVDVNVRGTVNILELARKTGAKIVYSSASSVYGTPSSPTVREESELRPTSIYGATKASSEILIRTYSHIFDIPYTIFRFTNVYGPGQVNGVIPAFFRSIKDGEPITISGDGSQLRDFVFVDDVVYFLLRAFSSDVVGTFNLGSGRCCTINQLFDLCCRVAGKTVERVYSPGHRDERSFSAVDLTRLLACFGETPSTDLEEGLKRTWQEYL